MCNGDLWKKLKSVMSVSMEDLVLMTGVILARIKQIRSVLSLSQLKDIRILKLLRD